MKLNLELSALLFGILVIGLAGRARLGLGGSAAGGEEQRRPTKRKKKSLHGSLHRVQNA